MAGLELIKMSEVDKEDVNWLWYPYIPYGKITIIHGNPGDGKTNIALKIAAACTKGEALPGDVPKDPINVIYQTAEDGLGDTIRPRLEEADADLDRIITINEEKKSLTLKDERIEEALQKTNAKLLILDPIQAYVGGDLDMNRANEVREILKPICKIAQSYGCAVVLIGHLNKAQGMNSVYRGMGSVDFAATVRSILIVGRYKEDPNVRILVHDKASLAPEGASVAFKMDESEGFKWLDGYENVTSDEILSSTRTAKDKPTTKLAQAVEFLEKTFSEIDSMPANEIIELGKLEGFSERTLKEAKKYVKGLESYKREAYWAWGIKKETNGEEGSKHAEDCQKE